MASKLDAIPQSPNYLLIATAVRALAVVARASLTITVRALAFAAAALRRCFRRDGRRGRSHGPQDAAKYCGHSRTDIVTFHNVIPHSD